jgi:hypothetical protein
MEVTLILIRLKSPSLLDEFPINGKIIMDLGGIKILNAQRSRIDGHNSHDSITSDAANQAIQEVVELITQRTLTKCGPKYIPLVGGLYHAADFRKMWPKNVPLNGGLCHAADFNQMWLETCASCRKTVSQLKPKL